MLDEGWLTEARRVPPLHYSYRPDDENSPLPVAYNISLPPGKFGGPWIDVLFAGTANPNAHPYFAGITHLCVSAHCLTRRDGETMQYVPFDRCAWHVGISSYQGQGHCNDLSIGIELEGTDMLTYTGAQYQQPAAVTNTLTTRHPAITNDITEHRNIMPERKTDPGPSFDWAGFRILVAPLSHKEMT